MEKRIDQKKPKNTNPFSDMEQDVLDFWDKAQTFKKSVEKYAPNGDYIFYDGPPFATGMPHYGHIVASIMKDAIPRYWTMKGYRIERKWGWDCHGLPVENLAEQELKLKDKTDIEKIGVDKFNDYCKSIVLRYANNWKRTIKRIGRWVDMENDYKTMDPDYMESIWWVFKRLWDKGLIYKGYKSMHICPRCGTTLSNFEVSQGYKDVKDLSVIVKFKIKNPEKIPITRDVNANVYLLAWTTTPWTLIGNVALAVGNDVEYLVLKKDLDLVIVSIKAYDKGGFDNFFIQAPKDKAVLKGSDLVGIEYESLFDYYSSDNNLENKENGWKVYDGDFVTTEEGTGIVHIAPAFGDDDMNLGKKYELPFIQHVDSTGRIKKEAVDFAGKEVKPKDDHTKTDVEIIKYLAKKKLLFSKEKYEHSYPHCWRCDTPLLNYATDSWFVEVTKFKEKLVKTNQNIHWVPGHMRDGRFGKWLEQAKDWAISRNRYWGAPLPVWMCEECKETEVIGSINELTEKTDNITKFIFIRHGESTKNIERLYSSKNDGYPLTEQGIINAGVVAEELKDMKVDKIFSSPVERARQTAEIISKKIKQKVELSELIREIDSGEWDEHSLNEDSFREEIEIYDNTVPDVQYKMKRGHTGETWENLDKRISEFLQKVLKEYKGKAVVVVTHQGSIPYALRKLEDLDLNSTHALFRQKKYQDHAKPITVYVDAKTGKRVDLHKQYVDEITWKCQKCNEEMKRIPEVLDCWFESGSMPYAQEHYPFENKERFEKNYPANFIAEGLDQTRGWFYTMHVLANALDIKEEPTSSFKNVIVNGIVLAEDGQKMSKRLNNYPDPAELFEKYSVDAMRYYLLSSPVLVAENLNFSEEGVRDSLRKINMLLWNVFKFFYMFAEGNSIEINKSDSDSILDKWIIARLNQLINETTKQMNDYVIPKAIRPISDFIDDLSTWYLRRSRDRFKGDNEKDKQAAVDTTGYVLVELSKVMAPFMPFIAEQIWQKVTGNNFEDENKSVHLEAWPVVNEPKNPAGIPKGKKQKILSRASAGDLSVVDEHESKIIKEMEIVKKIVELGLAKRDELEIKVRQPLKELLITNYELGDKYKYLVLDELNVKSVVCKKGNGELKVDLDTEITTELKQEGIKRELVRFINAMRKQANLTIQDTIYVYWDTENKEMQEALQKYSDEIKKDTLAQGIEKKKIEVDFEKEAKINGAQAWLGIKKI